MWVRILHADPVCGSSSAVERDIANVEVAGSTPVSRSILKPEVVMDQAMVSEYQVFVKDYLEKVGSGGVDRETVALDVAWDKRFREAGVSAEDQFKLLDQIRAE